MLVTVLVMVLVLMLVPMLVLMLVPMTVLTAARMSKQLRHWVERRTLRVLIARKVGPQKD